MSNSQIIENKTGSVRTVVLQNRIRFIVFITITYNLIEAVVAIIAGNISSSSALIGFGLDSSVEVLSAIAVAWQFSASNPKTREKFTLKVIAISFFALAIFVSFESIEALISTTAAEPSNVGIILASLSLIIMPFLSWAERKTGIELGSASAVADSKQTLICTYLSAVLLAGLLLNSLFGLWWADPIAALVIAVVAFREGLQAWRGDICCSNIPFGKKAEYVSCSDGCCS